MVVFVVGEFGEGGDNLAASVIGEDTLEGAGVIGEKDEGDDERGGGGRDDRERARAWGSHCSFL